MQRLIDDIPNPTDSVFAANGNLLVASAVLDEVREYDPATGEFLGVFASGNGLDTPIGLILGPNGDLFVSSFQTDSVKRIDGTTGRFLGDFVSPRSGGLDGTHFFVFVPGRVESVPSMSAGGLVLLMATFVAGLSIVVRSRYRQRSSPSPV